MALKPDDHAAFVKWISKPMPPVPVIIENNDQISVSNALIMGDDKNSVLARDEDVQYNRPQDSPCEDQTFLNKWENSPTTAATTMLDLARVRNGWDPLSPKSAENQTRFQDFIDDIMANTGFFHPSKVESHQYDKESSDWSTIISDIAGIIVGAGEENVDQVTNSLEKLANDLLSHVSEENTYDLFVDNIIDVNSGSVEIRIFWGTIEFTLDEGVSGTTKQTHIDIKKLELEFKAELWNAFYAKLLCQEHFRSVVDWLTGNQSPPGDQKRAALCLTRRSKSNGR